MSFRIKFYQSCLIHSLSKQGKVFKKNYYKSYMLSNYYNELILIINKLILLLNYIIIIIILIFNKLYKYII